MKIAIISDIEGVTGSVWGGYGQPQSGELPYYTEVMTAEIDTVVRTLHAEGADEIVVFEAHKMQPGVLPRYARLCRDYKSMRGSDALFFIGQHGMAGDARAVQAHTMNSLAVSRVRLNGMPAGELTLQAAMAGAMGFPTVFVSGDEQTGREARRNLPPLEFVRDERGYGNHAAICRPFASLRKELAAKTRLALKRIGRTKPFDIGKVTLEFIYRYDGVGGKLENFPFFERKGHRHILRAPDMATAMQYYRLHLMGRDPWSFAIQNR
jgi:D-amino peptidase